ncbi:MAG: DMT family transporter [Marinilabiliales bacterium]|nr:DMT family transporter [Marinilabiliales bacterium]
MKREITTAYLKLHLIVLIYGFTAVLGKLIQLPALELVWYRMILAVATFFVYLLIRKESFRVPFRTMAAFFGIGLIIALHWVTFFGAIKLSNISVALGCFATTTLFTSFLEPFFFRKRINWIEVLTGLLILAGLYLIFRFETRYAAGMAVALFSAFLAGLFTVLNRKLVARHKAVIISFYEMIGGMSGLTVLLLIMGFADGRNLLTPSWSDLFYLFLLGTLCTAFAHTIQVAVMKHLTAYNVTLTINLEPVYGILMAFFFFGESERMTTGFYLGTLIILASVFGYPISAYYRQKKRRDQ